MKHMRLFVAMAAVAAAMLIPASGASVQAQAVAQSYIADSALQAGMVVRLAEDETKVTAVAQNDAHKIHGVVVRPNDAPLSLSEASKAGQQVYVATTGSYRVLVSTQNGAVAKDDYVVVSAIQGIGMKADKQAQIVVGKALDSFDGASRVLSETTVKDSNGNERTVKIGYVTTDINIRRNPLYEQGEAVVPGFLQQAVDTVADKPVSPLRAYLSLAVIIITGGIVSVVLYASVRTSVIALGRNPLARKTIIRSLFQVILIGLIILITGLFAVYLLLKL